MSQHTVDPNNIANIFGQYNTPSSMASIFRDTPEGRQMEHHDFVMKNFVQYLEDKKKVIGGLLGIEFPESITDELSIIITESKDFNIEFGYPFSMLDNVIEYISKQQLHLGSIRSKLGKDSRTYLRISSSVVEISIITIMCVLNEIESQFKAYNNEMMVSSMLKHADVRRRYEIAYNAINILSSFDMEYGYNYNRFTPCKQDIERACLSKYELRKSNSGCMGVLAILIVSTLTPFL